MIEVKSDLEHLVKFDIKHPGNFKMDKAGIKDYAINGAIHYCNCILANSHYTKAIAIGITGINSYGIYLIERDNKPQRINKEIIEFLQNI